MTQSNRPGDATTSRRRLLQTLTASGSMAIAGCGMFSGSGNTTDVSRDTPTAIPQTLRIPVTENAPNKTSFYRQAPDHAFAGIVKEPPTGRLERLVWEPGVWLEGQGPHKDFHYNWIDEISRTPTEITVSIRDDAQWSDGNPIVGTDIAAPVLVWAIYPDFFPFYANDRKEEPHFLIGAFDDFEITDKSVTYRSSPGFFDLFWKSQVGLWLGRTVIPTHIAPYESYAEKVIETARRAQQGDINPWERSYTGNSDPNLFSIQDEHLVDKKYVKKFSMAENVLATGTGDLVELRGSEAFVFQKNPHHRNADSINFETVVLTYMPSADREQAALKADRLDYRAGVTPQQVVDSLPTHITELRVPGGWDTGNEFGLNFNHPALGDRKIRMALMYALDQSTIANNIHQSTALPVDNPGGDTWNATDYVSQDWIDENLTTYATNRNKAATLMQEAGYTKDGDQWVTGDGEALTLTLATKEETPRWEPSVASQLSDFGIQTSVKTLNDTIFKQRVRRGEFPIWATSGISASKAEATLSIWLDAVRRPQKHGIYPDEQFATGKFSTNGTPMPRTEERWSAFTINAPPIGKPDASLKEYHPLVFALGTTHTEEEYRRRVKISMWLVNWLLPTIPINKTLTQHFIDDAHWKWPKDSPSWSNFTGGGPRTITGMVSTGIVQSNPDNPEKEA